MCDFCERGKSYTDSNKGLDVSIKLVWKSGHWRIWIEHETAFAETESSLEISYCPICGRKLYIEGGV